MPTDRYTHLDRQNQSLQTYQFLYVVYFIARDATHCGLSAPSTTQQFSAARTLPECQTNEPQYERTLSARILPHCQNIKRMSPILTTSARILHQTADGVTVSSLNINSNQTDNCHNLQTSPSVYTICQNTPLNCQNIEQMSPNELPQH